MKAFDQHDSSDLAKDASITHKQLVSSQSVCGNVGCEKSLFIDFLGGKTFLNGCGTNKLKNDDDGRVGRWLRGYLGTDWKNGSTTFESFCAVAKSNPKEIATFKKRLSNDCDARNYQATLGELRAFADLLKLRGFNTVYRGEKQAGCDFLVHCGGNSEASFQIEVFTMQDRPNSKSPLSISEDHGMVCMSETEVCPFGIPDSNSNVTLEMVCKICAIKERTKQVNPASPALLYIDFQSIYPFGAAIAEHCIPMLEWNGAFTSGGIWLSFYGEKQQTVLDNMSRAEHSPTIKLPIAGRFSAECSSPFAGAILSFPIGHGTTGGRLVYLENPHAEHPLNPLARDAILKHPDCNLLYSFWSTPDFNLIDYIEQLNNRCEVIVSELIKGF